MIGLVILVVLASVLGTTAALAKNQAPPQSPVTIKATFHDAMRTLWTDHVIWTRQVIVDVFASSDGLPDLSVAMTRLLANQDDIGNAVKPYYGDIAGNHLTVLLTNNIQSVVNVLNALKDGASQDVLNHMIEGCYNSANAIADFLNSANPQNWPLDETKAAMKQHVDLSLAEVMARFNLDWTNDVAAFDEAHSQILMVADLLSSGIIAQFPQKFTEGFAK